MPELGILAWRTYVDDGDVFTLEQCLGFAVIDSPKQNAGILFHGTVRTSQQESANTVTTSVRA